MMDMEMNADLDGDDGSESGQSSSEGSSASETFCALERDYARIVKEMRSNEALAAFEAEYTRLYESLYGAHKTEQRLSEKCALLKEELADGTREISELRRLIAEKEQETESLGREIVKGLKLADAAHAREQSAQEMIENLRLNVAKLNAELERKTRQLAAEGDASAGKQEGLVPKEKERLVGEMETLKQRLANAAQYTEELEKRVSEADRRIEEMQESLEARSNETSKERRAKQRAEAEARELREELGTRTTDLETANSSIKAAAANVLKLESLLKEQKADGEKMRKEIGKLMLKRMNLQTDLDNATVQTETLEKEVLERDEQLRGMKRCVNRMREESSRSRCEKDAAEKRLLKIDADRSRLEAELKGAATSAKNAECETMALRRQGVEHRQRVEALLREKNVLARGKETTADRIKALEHELLVCEQGRKKIQRELEEATRAAAETRKQLEAAERERDKARLEGQELARKGRPLLASFAPSAEHIRIPRRPRTPRPRRARRDEGEKGRRCPARFRRSGKLRVEEYEGEVRLRQAEVRDRDKRLAEAEARSRHQQNLFENVRAERNACGKSLAEAQEEIRELESKARITDQQIEQLKEDIAGKEASLAKGEFVLGRAEKERERARQEARSARKEASDLRREIEERKREEKQLRGAIERAEAEIGRQRKDIENATSERDILGTQLVRRNDELSLQYGRIKVLGESLRRGEAQYEQRLEDVGLLKLETRRLRTEKALLSKGMANVGDLRREAFRLNRELAKERIKVVALEEEARTPLNVHRWRKLEGTDPTSYELLAKVQLLQRRLARMAAQAIDREKRIRDTERLYANLCEITAKQPGPRSAVELALDRTRRALRERGRRMKCLVAELNAHEVQASEHRLEVERMAGEMRELRSKGRAPRGAASSRRPRPARSRSVALPILPPKGAAEKRREVYGGGFSLATQPKPAGSRSGRESR
ncbi:hypothetical protein KM043_003356 [Ampulex compressa]|nr:hypothetical protein KM043_003356 [Ampulex compressa]